MLLIFGGTTEGRAAAKVADEAGQPFFYSTKSAMQQLDMHHGQRLCAAMTATDIAKFVSENNIRCMVDAAHPFAEHLHEAILQAAHATNTPVVRYERDFGPTIPDAIYCQDFDDAVRRMEEQGINTLLALSGANTIRKLKAFWLFHKTYFRILHRQESIDQALAEQFPLQHLVFYNDANELPSLDAEIQLMRQLQPDAIITKESGASGGVEAKVEAARQLGIQVFVVKHPVWPPSYNKSISGNTTHPSPFAQPTLLLVTGPCGLRRAIEQLIPEFFPLRTGFTTGACATAAAHAALHLLLTGEELEEAKFLIPNGETMTIPIASVRMDAQGNSSLGAEAAVVKDAGDDPDVTNGCTVRVKVERTNAADSELQITFHAGEGVGTVTLPGLGIEVGGPAINSTPRRMIADDFQRQGAQGHYDLTISVDGGAALAQRTFNPKVGVVGGISIIGTSGIVRPLSNEAFVESIGREIDVAIAVGTPRIVINSGARSEAFVRSLYPDLSPQAFIHYGNFIGETLRLIGEKDDRVPVTLGLMIGKAVKLAEGHLDTHSHKITMNKVFLCHVAAEAGCTETAISAIRSINLARQLWEVLPTADAKPFFSALISHCRAACADVFPSSRLTLYLITDDGTIVAEEK